MRLQNINSNKKTKKMDMTFEQKFRAFKDKYIKPVLYNRNEAYRLLGFKNSKSFTDWLRENDFMGYNDYPYHLFLEKGFIVVKSKLIGKSRPTDACGAVIGGSVYDSPSDTVKTIYTPLFTEKGISFFKELLADPEKFHKVVEEIKLLNQYYHIKII